MGKISRINFNDLGGRLRKQNSSKRERKSLLRRCRYSSLVPFALDVSSSISQFCHCFTNKKRRKFKIGNSMSQYCVVLLLVSGVSMNYK